MKRRSFLGALVGSVLPVPALPSALSPIKWLPALDPTESIKAFPLVIAPNLDWKEHLRLFMEEAQRLPSPNDYFLAHERMHLYIAKDMSGSMWGVNCDRVLEELGQHVPESRRVK